MKNLFWIMLLLLVWTPVSGASAATSQGEDTFTPQSDGVATDGVEDMAFSREDSSDPLEPFNRAMFKFNDLFYSSVLRPVSTLYEKIMPEPVRVGGRNFFHNLAAPKHFLSAALQGKAQQAGVEVSRFCVNTLLGGLGFVDVAERFGLLSADEDIGQVLGHYGAGDDFYLVLPVLGPSNLRDGVGLVGDTLLSPLTYMSSELWIQAAVFSYRTVNETSLRLGEYEDFKKAAFDPYISLRDAYLQRRVAQIED